MKTSTSLAVTLALLLTNTLNCLAQGTLYSEFFFTSTPESWVGHGVTEHNQGIGYTAYGRNGAIFRSGSATVILGGVNGDPLAVGDFPAERFAWTDHTGLDFSYDHRGNNTLTGSINVLEIGYTEPDYWGNRQVTKAAVDFVQFDGGIASRRNEGSIRFNSSVPATITAIPEPSTLALLGMAASTLLFRRRLG